MAAPDIIAECVEQSLRTKSRVLFEVDAKERNGQLHVRVYDLGTRADLRIAMARANLDDARALEKHMGRLFAFCRRVEAENRALTRRCEALAVSVHCQLEAIKRQGIFVCLGCAAVVPENKALVCSGCGVAVYCSRECQKTDRWMHKHACFRVPLED